VPSERCSIEEQSIEYCGYSSVSEVSNLLGGHAVTTSNWLPTFQRMVMPSSSGSTSQRRSGRHKVAVSRTFDTSVTIYQRRR
jgi:hypothetical protein